MSALSAANGSCLRGPVRRKFVPSFKVSFLSFFSFFLLNLFFFSFDQTFPAPSTPRMRPTKEWSWFDAPALFQLVVLWLSAVSVCLVLQGTGEKYKRGGGGERDRMVSRCSPGIEACEWRTPMHIWLSVWSWYRRVPRYVLGYFWYIVLCFCVS